MSHRCGEMTSRGVKCKQIVENAGDKCRFHINKVSSQVENQHSHSDSEVSNGSSRSASQSQVSQSEATNEMLSGLLEKISLLEAELKRATACNNATLASSRHPVAKAAATATNDKTTGKKKRAMTPAGAMVKARWIFYNEHKTDVDILEAVRGGLIKGSMLVKKTQVVNGVTIEKEIIPYTLVKIATDMKFEKLSQDDMEAYILEAYEHNEAKYA